MGCQVLLPCLSGASAGSDSGAVGNAYSTGSLREGHPSPGSTRQEAQPALLPTALSGPVLGRCPGRGHHPATTISVLKPAPSAMNTANWDMAEQA
jgi:hypothetical protein